MKKINLSGAWSLKQCETGKTFPALLPGSDIGNLIKGGFIKNPLFSGDEKEGISYCSFTNEFSREFSLDGKALEEKHIRLVSGGFDTLCECFINGKSAFKTNNAFIPVDREIKPYLKEGQNKIALRFSPAVKYIQKMQKENPLPKNFNGVDGIPYIRKPACHFGWDWGPCVPYCAVNDYIGLEIYEKRIENIRIFQDTSKIRSKITASADGAEFYTLLSPIGEVIEKNKTGIFTVESPELWYTREMNGLKEQPLYTIVFENNEDKRTKKIGLRSLYLDRKNDEYGQNFRFILNGEEVFAKGANLIPFSAIPEDSGEKTEDYYLDLAQRANFNMLRIWGGGSFAGEHLLDECDKRGILVWQDFLFACQLYPLYDGAFKENVLSEIKANVPRLSSHACLALFCGNNEIESMYSYMPKSSRLIKSYTEFFYKDLPEYIKPLTDASYIPTSPLGSEPFKENTADKCGDTHMWNVWHGLKKTDYYAKRYTRFLSEFGLDSLPSMKAIKTFAKPGDYDINSKAFNSHQKCAGGNEKMLFYLTEMFNMPEDFEALPYLTGILQAECVKNATVHFRQNKGRCNGSLFWQFNDVWNCPSWSSVDFEGVPKALQYKAREFFAPVTFTVKKEKGKAVIFAHNDTLKKECIKLELTLLNPDLKKEYDVEIEPNSFKKIDEIKIGKKSVLRLEFGSEKITEIFTFPLKFGLKKANIKVTQDENKLCLTSDEFAYDVFIDSGSPVNDNYFSLLPGETREVEFKEKPKEYKIVCANNIKYKNRPVKRAIFRLFYRLKPMNIANYFYYTFN